MPAPARATRVTGLMQSPPKVTVVVVTYDPGEYFAECLQSISGMSYPNSEVVVVNVGGGVRASEIVEQIAPHFRLLSLAGNPGFSAAANFGAAESTGSQFLLICHDDVALAPNALAAMVEVAYASNAGVVTPKMVGFDSPRQILALGENLDFTMSTAPRVEVGDLDQGQYDEIQEVPVAPGGAMLVRSDLWRALEGYDEKIRFLHEDVDLSVRARLLGARVVTAPHAKVRHKQVLTGSRRRSRVRGVHRGLIKEEREAMTHAERIGAKRRNQLRCVQKLEASPTRNYASVFFVVAALLEAAYYLVTARPRVARSTLSAIPGVFFGRRALQEERRQLAAGGSDFRLVSYDGRSLTIGRFVEHWRSTSELSARARDEVAEASGRRMLAGFDAPSRWMLFIAVALSIVALHGVILGSTTGVGSFAAVPSSAALLSSYLHSAGSSGWLGTSVEPASVLLFGLLGLLVGGDAALAVHLLVLGSLVAGPVAVYKLAARRVPPQLARFAGALYAVGPALGVAAANASIYQLFAYALAPILMLATLKAVWSQRRSRRAMRGANLRLSLLAAVALAIAPQAVVVWLVLGVIEAAVYALSRDGMRSRRLAISLAYGGLAAVVLNLPWVAAMVVYHPGLNWILTGTISPYSSPISLLAGGGIVGGASSWLLLAEVVFIGINVLLFQPASVRRAVLSGIGAAISILGAVAAERGLLGGTPISSGYLLDYAGVFAAIGSAEAFSTILGDLHRYKLGLRQLLVGVTVAAVSLASLAAAASFVIGFPQSPTSFQTDLPVLAGLPGTGGSYLWVNLGYGSGPVRGVKLTNGLEVSVTGSALPDLISAGQPGVTRGYIGIESTISKALAGGTVRLGGVLADLGIRYVSVIDSGSMPVLSQTLGLGFSRQIDLTRQFTTQGMTVYEVSGTVTRVAPAPAAPLWVTAALAVQGLALGFAVYALARRRSLIRRANLDRFWPGSGSRGARAAGSDLVGTGQGAGRP